MAIITILLNFALRLTEMFVKAGLQIVMMLLKLIASGLAAWFANLSDRKRQKPQRRPPWAK